MYDLEHLKGNFIIAASGIGISYLSKTFFRKEFIPVSSGKQIIFSFSFLSFITIIGKITMDEFAKLNWVNFNTAGKDKVENEGFIGPLTAESFMGPPHLG